MSGRDARSRTRRIVSLLTLTLLILRAQDAFSGSDVDVFLREDRGTGDASGDRSWLGEDAFAIADVGQLGRATHSARIQLRAVVLHGVRPHGEPGAAKIRH